MTERDADRAAFFNPARYAPVRVGALMQLPESNARAFVVAAALGHLIDDVDPYKRLRGGEAKGSVINKKRRGEIQRELRINDRRWRQNVANWESRNLAHRCDKTTLCLLLLPLMPECPSCHMAIELRGPTPSDNRRKARREANSGTTTAASPAGVLPPSGLSTAAEAASTLPPPVANDGALGDRYLQGVEVGVGGGQGPSSPSPAIDTARWARDLLNAEQVGAFLRGEGGAR